MRRCCSSEPLNTALRWRGRPELASEEPLPPLPSGWVLIRVEYALWSGVEEAERQGLLWPEYGVTMGHSGAGVVVEAAETGLQGYVAPAALCGCLPGYSCDGWLAYYTVYPAGCLEPAPRSPLASLSLPLSLACDTTRWLSAHGASKVLVLGAGAYGVATALLLSDMGIDYTLVTSKRLRGRISRMLHASSSPGSGYDAVVVAIPAALRLPKETRLLVLHPYVAASLPAPEPGRELEAYTPRGLSNGCWRSLLTGRREVLGQVVRTVEEGGLAEPPPFLGDLAGYVIGVKAARRAPL